jgi:ribosomal-protein-serine acetyltransferase
MFRLTVTPEIELRLWDVADADIAFEAVARNRASLREWLPWVDRTHSAEDLRTYFRTIVTPQFDSNRSPNCGIWVDGEVAGSVGCHPIDWANRSCAMGYWLDEKFRGRGVMTKSCAAMLSHLFDNEKLHRVAIRCATGNTKSCAIPERLGFRREGLERDAEWVAGRWVDLWNWAILESEWPGKSP